MLISNTTIEDLDVIKTICDAQLGANYISRYRIITANISITAIDECEYPTKIIGWAAADIVNEKLGQLSHCTVRPGYEGRGVATALVRKRLEKMAAIGIKNCVSYCWMHPNGYIPMKGILTRFGFVQNKILKMAFNGTNCVFCGKNCVCDCVVFFKKGL